MRDSYFWNRFFPVLFMVLITVVFIGVVSGIYLATRETIKLNESLFLKRAVLYAADIPLPESATEIDSIYRDRVNEVTDEDDEILYFEILDGQRLIGYAVFAYGPGLWGEIGAVVGFEDNLEILTGIDFIKQNETPGLGARISEEWFREQFRGRRGPFKLVPEGTRTEENELDAITGASYTSDFVLSLVNRTVEEVGERLGR